MAKFLFSTMHSDLLLCIIRPKIGAPPANQRVIMNIRKFPETSNSARFVIGFLFGTAIMFMVTNVFLVNHFDFDNMQRGVRILISGVNPWAPETRISHFYNPPFAILFLWPLLFTTPKIMLVLGSAFLFGLIFYWKAWTAIAWFMSNTFLFLIAAGGIDIFLIGSGLSCLVASDRFSNKIVATILRVIGYGLLMVKFQGGVFIVIIYILLRRDWYGLLISVLIYGVFFIPLIPSWIQVIVNDPPLSQTEAAHSIWARFGPIVSIPVAILVLFSRKWKYWQIGGALAGILAPYGMVGLPIFLTLTAVKRKAAIPAYVIFSGCLAIITWITPINQDLMCAYHLSMLGLALMLACLIPNDDPVDTDTISISPGSLLARLRSRTIKAS